MKKIAISLAALAVVASAAFAGPKEDANQGPTGLGEGTLDCSGAASITCGGSASGPLGPGGTVAAYGCTTLSYDGAEEAVVEFCVGGAGSVSVDMTYAHGAYNDLDLFVLGSCDPGDCLGASLGTSGAENVTANLAAGTYYAVVDGWNGLADGSGYDLSVSCSTPCTNPVIESTWGAVKSIYAN
ncbi:MAG: hypothetical protein R3E97_21070 [Candidatus Eisenbacteria bacterium]